jgi:DNA-directed RNA polymerase specialized sigma24 family protein
VLEDLIERRRRGEDVFEDLWIQLTPIIRCVLNRILDDKDEIEDCAQDVAVKLIRKLHLWEERSALSSWVYALARMKP